MRDPVLYVARTDRNGMRCRLLVAKEEAARARARRGTERNGLEVGKTAAIDTRQIKPPNWKQSQPNGAAPPRPLVLSS